MSDIQGKGLVAVKQRQSSWRGMSKQAAAVQIFGTLHRSSESSCASSTVNFKKGALFVRAEFLYPSGATSASLVRKNLNDLGSFNDGDKPGCALTGRAGWKNAENTLT